MSYIDDWIWLHVPCPIENCNSITPTYWSHMNCPFSEKDHDLKINSAGYLRCSACNRTDMIINWRFDCGLKHGLKEVSNLNRLVEILQIMGKATTDQGFIGRLLGAVSIMFLNQK